MGEQNPQGLAVIIPMLGRPQRVEPLLESLYASCDPRVVVVRAVFAVSPDDDDVHAAVDRAGAERLTVPRRPLGDYARKIQAGIDHTTEPLIFTGADDLRFRPGWFEAAASLISDTVGVVGTNDLANPRVMAGQHATHVLVARWYVELGTIDEPGVLMHHGYHHEFVDDELVGTAKKRSAWAFAADSHVEHLHPLWREDGYPWDPMYEAMRDRIRASSPHYNRRRRLWR